MLDIKLFPSFFVHSYAMRSSFFLFYFVCALFFTFPLTPTAFAETTKTIEQSQPNTSTTNQTETPTTLSQNIPQNLPPLTVQARQDVLYLAPYLRYATQLNAQTPQEAFDMRASFMPYDSLTLQRKLGTYWFLLQFEKISDENIAAAYLDIGNFLPKNSKILILPKNSKQWQVLDDVYTREKLGVSEKIFTDKTNPITALASDLEEHATEINMFASGLYDLTSLRNGGELLIYSPGMPSIWFSPSLVLPAKAALSIDRRIAPFVLISLVLLMIFSLWRGLREEGDARLWATLLTFFALIQYIWGVPENTSSQLNIWHMIGAISASCALFLLPHIGRHYMITEKNAPSLDAFLQFLALPAVFPVAILFVPLSEYLPIIRLAPLWGLYAFIPLIACIPALLSKQKGARFYIFFCLCIGTGALLSFMFRINPAWYIAPQVGLVFAMSAMFLAPRQNEKNVFEKEQKINTDIVSEFVENSVPMREAFFRVEAKLREPFDKIIREACFLDFDTKAEDFTYSLDLLSEKEFADKYTKNDLNAINDLVRRAARLQSHTDTLVRACRELSGMMGIMPQLAKKVPQFQPMHELFNLKSIVLQAFNLIREEAQDKQIGLGWYIAPQMGLFYRGDKETLFNVIELLLKDSIRATEKGMISLRVRRANSPNPGHIVFTISDSGKGRPPVERSPLTLIKAWELASNYNGEVSLSSSPTGLSFSFSMECVAMDAQGLKALSFASLDDIVLLNQELEKNKILVAQQSSSGDGESGGNIVFSKEIPKQHTNPLHTENTHNHTNFPQNTNHSFATAQAPHHAHAVASPPHPTNQDSIQTHLPTRHTEHDYTHSQSSPHALGAIHTHVHDTHTLSTQEYDNAFTYQSKTRENILLISPLAIQRQNLAWYLNQYELWEALDVDSALAFYEKKPAMLVIVHSALTANGCNAVLAGIRLLEDSLGISPAPFLGLYQSAKDMEFLQLAGCKHLLPANIGREDLCIAVEEIMLDPQIAPISDIHAPYAVLRKQREKEQEKNNQEEAKLAVEKRLNMKRVHAGQVIDGAVDFVSDFNNKTSYTSAHSISNKDVSNYLTTTLPHNSSTHSPDSLTNNTTSSAEPTSETTNLLTDATTQTTASNLPDFEPQNDLEKNMMTTEEDSAVSSLHMTDTPLANSQNGKKTSSVHRTYHEHVQYQDTPLATAHLSTEQHTIEEQKGLFSKFLHIIRPKPNKSLQTETLIIDDSVGEAMPMGAKTDATLFEPISLDMQISLDIQTQNDDTVEHIGNINNIDSTDSIDNEDNLDNVNMLDSDTQKALQEEKMPHEENAVGNATTLSQKITNKTTDEAYDKPYIEESDYYHESKITDEIITEITNEVLSEATQEPLTVIEEPSETYEKISHLTIEKHTEESTEELTDELETKAKNTENPDLENITLENNAPKINDFGASEIEATKAENNARESNETENNEVEVQSTENHEIENSEDAPQSVKDSQTIDINNPTDTLALSFMPTENQVFQAIDEDIPMLGSLDKAFQLDVNMQDTYLELENQNTFVHSGLLDTDLAEKSMQNEEKNNSEEIMEEDNEIANEQKNKQKEEEHIKETQIEEEEEILNLTDTMLIPNAQINPDKISKKRRKQNAHTALLNLDLELPTDQRKKKNIKEGKLKNRKKEEKSKLQEVSPVQETPPKEIKQPDPKPKFEQLSFFPVDENQEK